MVDLETPKIWFNGTKKEDIPKNPTQYERFYLADYLTKVTIDYHQRKIRGSVKYVQYYQQAKDLPVSELVGSFTNWYSFDDPKIEIKEQFI